MTVKPVRCCLLVGAVILAITPVFGQGGGPGEVSLNRGLQAFQAGNYRDARGHFETAIRDDPDLAAAHYFLGLTFLQTASQTEDQSERAQLLEWAAGEFERSNALAPDLVLARLDGAIVELIRGQFEQAESGLRRFIESRPDDPLPYLFLAIVYYRQAKEDSSAIPDALANLDRV